jgi:molecular chaperone HscB
MRDTHAEARDAWVHWLMQSHFELFGLQPAFAIDAGALERAYREVQAEVHPDRHAGGSDADKRAAMQWTTRANEAYRTLKSPLERARYLLEQNGIDVAFETNTAMPADFLAQQMEWREALEDAKDGAALDALQAEIREAQRGTESAIGSLIDGKRDYAGAAGLVRKLKFLMRLHEEIDEARDEVDA